MTGGGCNDEAEVDAIRSRLEEEAATPFGFEVAPFKVGWYNEAVDDKRFAMSHLNPDTLAFVVSSAPCMFEKAFLPFVAQRLQSGQSIWDPLDQCMRHHFQRMCDLFPEKSDGYDIEAMHDFDMVSPVSKRPKVLVQTAGHVAAVARFYRQQDLDQDGLTAYSILNGGKQVKRIFPVCVHPKYGGWFGLRGVLLFKNVRVPGLVRQSPPEVLRSQEDIARLLYLFNDHWRDWRYRDVGLSASTAGGEQYSELQKEYFALSTDQRQILLKKLLSPLSTNSVTTSMASSVVHVNNSSSNGCSTKKIGGGSIDLKSIELALNASQQT